MTNQERNVFTFSIMSLLVQLFITIMVTMAQAGATIMDPSDAQDLAPNLITDIEDRTTRVGVTVEEVENMRSDTPLGDVWDPITWMLNFGEYIGKTVETISNGVLAYLSLGVYSTQAGSLSWIIIAIVGMWDLAMLYYILRFMFSGRFK